MRTLQNLITVLHFRLIFRKLIFQNSTNTTISNSSLIIKTPEQCQIKKKPILYKNVQLCKYLINLIITHFLYYMPEYHAFNLNFNN